MRSQLFLWPVLALVAGFLFWMVVPAQAAPVPAPVAVPCDPDNPDLSQPECRSEVRANAPAPAPTPMPVTGGQDVLPFTYAYVVTGPVALYSNPADATNGTAPLRMLDAGYVWVRLQGQVEVNGEKWYLTDGGGYLPASVTAIYRPSAFHGVTLESQPAFPFAWILAPIETSTRPGEQPGVGSAVFDRYDLVNLYEQQEVDGLIWYRVGENQWIVQTAVGKVEWTARPADVGPQDRWLDVNLFEQTLAAYEGDRMVYATLVSSGLRRWPTAKGMFRISTKIAWGPMSGRENNPDYYSLEDVPWSMYFYEDYALHGAYWHDGFGYPHSHGCVNLSPADAQWLYDWTTPAAEPGAWGVLASEAAPGTWVWVHD